MTHSISEDAPDVSGKGFAPADADKWRSVWGNELVQHVLDTTTTGDTSAAIIAFDDYSERQGLGMNLGREKGDIIEKTVKTLLDSHQPLSVLELGAHFGDGTLRVVRALGAKPSPQQGANHVVVSVEADHGWASGCKAVVGHVLSGSSGSFIRHESVAAAPTALVALVDAVRAKHKISHFDLVLIDHDHGRYLEDLKALVEANALAVGSLVHADNAGRDARRLAAYLDYVNGGGPFATTLDHVRKPYKDSIAISQYLGTGKEL